ncbi:MAG: extracellular solute-binding protein [Chloroflexi bacterium]|nr:extracellular solute-binding protein [Chloroflexota bacterium]
MDTWAHYRDVCEWFTRPDKNMYGTADCRARNWGYWWWEMYYGSLANPNAYYFDDEMHPLVNSPEGIAATKLYASFKPTQHPDALSWDWAGSYSSFTNGVSFSMIAWPSLTKFAADKSTSSIVGKVGYTLCPGTMVDGTLIRRSIYSYGHNFMGWSYSKNPELAYLFAQWITSPEISPGVLEKPGVVDPFRLHDFIDPRVQKAYGADFLPIQKANFAIALPDIFLRGSGEYTQVLDVAVQEAFTGGKTAEDAMAQVAKGWEDVTERLGRADQIAAWKTVKKYYPTLTQYS